MNSLAKKDLYRVERKISEKLYYAVCFRLNYTFLGCPMKIPVVSDDHMSVNIEPC